MAAQNRLRDLVSEAMGPTRVDEVAEAISDGADVNWKYPNERAVLDYCVSLEPVYNTASEKDQRRLQIAGVLFEHGAKPNVTDKFGWTVVHQCAWNGDLPLLRLCVQKGGSVHTRNKSNQLPIDLASTRGHSHVIRYLDGQSKDLRCICRSVICEALNYNDFMDKLPLPSMVKLFLNHGNPYNGWKTTVVPPLPWTNEQLLENDVDREELRVFICNNASQDFIEENRDILEAKGGEVSELVQVLQSMYLWEAFSDVSIEEPPARRPRYSMEDRNKEEDVDDVKITKPKKNIL